VNLWITLTLTEAT